MNLILKIKKFIKFDIRTKLKIISKKIGLEIYPSLFKKKGIKKFHTKTIFNILINEKIKKIKKYNYDNIFGDINSQKKINFLIVLPRSGSNLIKNLLSSYFELYYKYGNGVPKYDGINDIWIRLVSPVVPADLFNAISFNENIYYADGDIKTIGGEEFEKKKILFSRYPVQNVDLVNINLMRPLIMIRNPIDQIRSNYVIDHFKFRKNNKELDLEKINKMIFQNLKYHKYWKDFVQNKVKDHDFMIMNFTELQNSTKTMFTKILQFYGYELDDDHIQSSININSKENYQKYMGERSNNTIRFAKKEMFDVHKIHEHLSNNKDFQEAAQIYKFLNEIK